jgi:hypothetical protein
MTPVNWRLTGRTSPDHRRLPTASAPPLPTLWPTLERKSLSWDATPTPTPSKPPPPVSADHP